MGYDHSVLVVIFMPSSQGYLGSAAEENRLQSHHGQLLKCIQLYNAILVRHGVVVLGPTGSGKSTVLKLLREALNNAYEDFYGHKRKVDVQVFILIFIYSFICVCHKTFNPYTCIHPTMLSL